MSTAVERAAAVLQARMSWPKADAEIREWILATRDQTGRIAESIVQRTVTTHTTEWTEVCG